MRRRHRRNARRLHTSDGRRCAEAVRSDVQRSQGNWRSDKPGLVNAQVRYSSESGIKLGSGAVAEVVRGSIVGIQSSGAFVEGALTQLSLRNVLVINSGFSGVYVGNGAAATIAGGRITSSKQRGELVGDDSTVAVLGDRSTTQDSASAQSAERPQCAT